MECNAPLSMFIWKGRNDNNIIKCYPSQGCFKYKKSGAWIINPGGTGFL